MSLCSNSPMKVFLPDSKAPATCLVEIDHPEDWAFTRRRILPSLTLNSLVTQSV